MYVAVKGGEKAIKSSLKLLEKKRKETGTKSIEINQIKEQLSFAVDRVINEGSLYDKDLSALAIKQSQGDLVEAIFLLRAYRTTLERYAYSSAIDTSKIIIKRRISASFKDIPGGQILGPTFDYSHRLLDFSLMKEDEINSYENINNQEPKNKEFPSVIDYLNNANLLEQEINNLKDNPFDVTRDPMKFPASRDQWMQILARGDEGFLLGLSYSAIRGFGSKGTHPFVGEIKYGIVDIFISPDELGFEICIGEIEISECQMIDQFVGNKNTPPQFTRGYGLTFGYNERKSMAISIVDRALKSEGYGEEIKFPIQDQEFVLYHADNVEAQGFVTHLKLPHYVDFQGELNLIRKLRNEILQGKKL